jgi:hypothetical protein
MRQCRTGELPPKHLRLFLNAQKKTFPLEKALIKHSLYYKFLRSKKCFKYYTYIMTYNYILVNTKYYYSRGFRHCSDPLFLCREIGMC